MSHEGLLRRNQLAYLTDAGWARLQQKERTPMERACVALWAERRLPLVVTRQPTPGGDAVALGLPAPARFRRKRLAVQVAREEILYFDAFPRMAAIARQFDAGFAAPWASLARSLDGLACGARVYGSRGWQALTGMLYVHETSDIDLMLPVGGVDAADTADEACALLHGFDASRPRVDGELVFPDGSAVAWREWQRWRAGGARELMVKRLRDVQLVTDVDWLAPVPAC